MVNWLVTGSEGFIGARLMAAVQGQGCDLKSDCDAGLISKGRDFTHIAHMAANAGIEWCIQHPRMGFQNNVEATQHVLDIARRNEAYLAFASSSAAAHPINPYAAHKAASEALCTAYWVSYGLRVGVLRFGNVYGPGSLHKSSAIAAWCKQAYEDGEVVVHGDGHQKRDFVYVDDVVAAVLAEPEGRWGVRTGVLTSVMQAACLVAEISGAGVRYADPRPYDVMTPRDDTPIYDLDYKKLSEGIEETWKWFKMELTESKEEKEKDDAYADTFTAGHTAGG